MMKRIIVVGTTGSGKSTLAKELAAKLNVSYIQLDLLFWQPNWTQSTNEVFFKKIEESIQTPHWVVDGNFDKANHLTWPHADTVIWIDFPFFLTLYQSFSRALKRAYTQEELWPGTNNRESFRMLFSKDSIIRWLFKTYKPHRERYLARMTDQKFSHIKFVRLRSRKEVRKLLDQITPLTNV